MTSHNRGFTLGVIVSLVLCAVAYYYYERPITDFERGYIEAVATMVVTGILIFFFQKWNKKISRLSSDSFEHEAQINSMQHDYNKRLQAIEKRLKINPKQNDW